MENRGSVVQARQAESEGRRPKIFAAEGAKVIIAGRSEQKERDLAGSWVNVRLQRADVSNKEDMNHHRCCRFSFKRRLQLYLQ